MKQTKMEGVTERHLPKTDTTHQPNAPYLTPLPFEGILSVTIPMTYTSNLTRAFTSHGYTVNLIHKQLFRGLHHPNPSCPPRSQPPVSHHPGLHRLKRILKEGFHILSSDPSTQDLLTNPHLSPSENPLTFANSLTRVYAPTVLPPPLAPDLAIDPDVRSAPFTIPLTPSPALALMSLTPSPPMLILSP